MKKYKYITPAMKIKYFGKEYVAVQQSGLPQPGEEYIEGLQNYTAKAQVDFCALIELN